ncbi:MAG: hypothetical protein OXU23_16405 [Candidatus Poribacteria bacterium]|nr:hypothetical protein [Candidatus Poribacteria bacterium]
MKNFMIPILLMGIVSLGIIGCGSDEEKPDIDESSEEKPVSQPDLPKEDLLGTWEVVSINGLTPGAFFESPVGEDLEGQAVEVKQFRFVLSADDSWIINLELEVIIAFPEILPGPEVVLIDGKMKIKGVWSGAYSVVNPMLFFITEEADVKITSDPEDFIEKLTEGQITNVQAEQDYIQEFKNIILTPFRRSTATLKEKTLTLNISGAKKMILERQ